MRIAAALSEHPVPAAAVGEAVGAVLDEVGEAPGFAAVFASEAHTAALGDIVETIRATLAPGVLVGATAMGILGGRREVEDAPALALWAACPPGDSSVRGVRVDALRTPTGAVLAHEPGAFDSAAAVVVLADPFSFPVEALAAEVPVPLIGGLASAARSPGGNRLVLDGAIHDDGAVAVALGPGAAPVTVVSQGCRPIGEPLVVTRAEGQVIFELAGRPALERLAEAVSALSPADRQLAAQGIHLGRVIDERRDTFERGDFLIRGVLGADRAAGAVAVGDVVGVGDTVQFQVRDAASADEDLRALMEGRSGTGSLVFTCNGRGRRFFGLDDHDATVVADALDLRDPAPVAGMFCAGEIGPVGPSTFVHGFTASVALFE